MKACGISLYRVAAPLVASALSWRAALMFALQEQVLALREPPGRRHRHDHPRRDDAHLRRRATASGWWRATADIYNYVFYDPRRQELNGLSIFQFAPARPAPARRAPT